MSKNSYTFIETGDGEGVHNCNDCGAYSFISEKDVKHHKSCVAGESKRWEKYYEKGAFPDDMEIGV